MEDFSTLGHLPSTPDQKTNSRKRVVEKTELAQNLARESLPRAHQEMKDHYDQKTKKNCFLKLDSVFVFIPRELARKGLSKRLMHNWLGPNRVIRS